MGALIVYDITQASSFTSVKKWVSEVRSLTEPDTILMLVGNKLDICTSQPDARKVSKTEAEGFAKEFSMLFMESSAEESTNVKEAFELLLEKIYSISKDHKEDPALVKVANITNARTSEISCC
jgi:GTPase SAR1 family protein